MIKRQGDKESFPLRKVNTKPGATYSTPDPSASRRKLLGLWETAINKKPADRNKESLEKMWKVAISKEPKKSEVLAAKRRNSTPKGLLEKQWDDRMSNSKFISHLLSD